jgi:hypothetical protein
VRYSFLVGNSLETLPGFVGGDDADEDRCERMRMAAIRR